MRDYGKVAPTFWLRGSGKALRGHPSAQVLALYLFTAPAASMTGLFYLALPSVRHETGLDDEEVTEALALLDDVGIAFYDDEAELMWVPEMARYQIGDELKPGDKRIKGVEREVAVHEGHKFYGHFVAKYRLAFSLSLEAPPPEPLISHRQPLPSPFQAPSKPLRSQDQEQEQEQDQEIPHSPQGGSANATPVEGGASQAEPSARPVRDAQPSAPASKQPEAHVRYADSYANGIREASGQDFAPPRRSKADLIDMAIHFGKAPGGAKLTGDDLLAWFRRIAAEYWRATSAEAKYQSGFSPKACLKWLNEGRGTRSLPYARAPSAPIQRAPECSAFADPDQIRAMGRTLPVKRDASGEIEI